MQVEHILLQTGVLQELEPWLLDFVGYVVPSYVFESLVYELC